MDALEETMPSCEAAVGTLMNGRSSSVAASLATSMDLPLPTPSR